MLKKLINTAIKIGQGVLDKSALDGLISKYPIESGTNFVKYSDGTLEQWGYGTTSHPAVDVYYAKTISFPIPFAKIDYSLLCSGYINETQGDLGVTTNTLTYFIVSSKRKDATYDTKYGWKAIGRWQ